MDETEPRAWWTHCASDNSVPRSRPPTMEAMRLLSVLPESPAVRRRSRRVEHAERDPVGKAGPAGFHSFRGHAWPQSALGSADSLSENITRLECSP